MSRRAWVEAAAGLGKPCRLTVLSDNFARRIYARLGFAEAQQVYAHEPLDVMTRPVGGAKNRRRLMPIGAGGWTPRGVWERRDRAESERWPSTKSAISRSDGPLVSKVTGRQDRSTFHPSAFGSQFPSAEYRSSASLSPQIQVIHDRSFDQIDIGVTQRTVGCRCHRRRTGVSTGLQFNVEGLTLSFAIPSSLRKPTARLSRVSPVPAASSPVRGRREQARRVARPGQNRSIWTFPRISAISWFHSRRFGSILVKQAVIRSAKYPLRRSTVTPESPERPQKPVETPARKPWVEPEVRALDIRETAAFSGRGADIGGNPAPDCQRS